MSWWENLPQCKVGDLVVFKSRIHTLPHCRLMLVIEVYPTETCRAQPCQNVICVDIVDGEEGTFDAARLEVISECG